MMRADGGGAQSVKVAAFDPTYPNLALSMTGADRIHKETKGEGAVTAVCDTGVYRHRDLVANLIDGFSVLGGVTRAGDTNDVYGHGTHVAGLIAANGGPDGLGFVGVSPAAKIMPVKILGDDGQGAETDIAKGIDQVVWEKKYNNVNIVTINLSIGGTIRAPEVTAALQNAVDNGIEPLAAMGNDNTSLPSWPAAEETCIAVCAVGMLGSKADFSNYGPNADISGPGVMVYSTYLNDTYAQLSGTSMATPIETGVANLHASRYFSRFGVWPGTVKMSPIATLLYHICKLNTVDLAEHGIDATTGAGLGGFLPRVPESRTVYYTVGVPSRALYVDGNSQSLPMDVAPYLLNDGRVMLPVRFVANDLDPKATVSWDQANQTVCISRFNI